MAKEKRTGCWLLIRENGANETHSTKEMFELLRKDLSREKATDKELEAQMKIWYERGLEFKIRGKKCWLDKVFKKVDE